MLHRLLVLFASLLVLANCRYNETEARMLLQMAAGAYGDGSDINECMLQALPPSDTHKILSVSAEKCDSFNNPCEGYIVSSYNARTLFMVFRGTRTDMQLLLEGFSTLFSGFDFYGMGLVNRYFLNGHEKLWSRINQTLNDPLYRDFRVVFTGHSLGGALAALAAARTVREGYRRSDQVKIVTFGEPRTGSAEFAFNFDRLVPDSYRVVFRMDLVPHMPACAKDKSNPMLTSADSRPCDPTALERPYHHGTEIWYPESMSPGSHYVECTGLPKNEDFGCSDQFKFKLSERNQYIWDHRNYFDVRVPTFGQAGCDLTLVDTSRRKRAIRKIRHLT